MFSLFAISLGRGSLSFATGLLLKFRDEELFGLDCWNPDPT